MNKLAKNYALGPLTLNSRGCSVPIGRGLLSSPPNQECFRSFSGKRKPFCTRPKRLRGSCEFCEFSWGLHQKKMSTMAKNRKSAKDSKAKRALEYEALRNDVNLNLIRYQKEVNTLTEIAKINSTLAEGIRKLQNELIFLEIEMVTRN